jgi:hypothetical protein
MGPSRPTSAGDAKPAAKGIWRLNRLGTSIAVQLLALLVAAGLHTTPLIPGLSKFIFRLFSPAVAIDRSPVEVSMDLDLGEENDEPKKTQEAPPPPPALPPPEAPPEPTNAPPNTFTMPTAAPPPSVSAIAPPKPIPTPTVEPTTPPKDETPKYVPEINDVGIAANPSGNPNNVVIILVGKTLRDHLVGEHMGTMLPKIGQWRDFFDGSGIDAVKDVDLMVLQGPQLRFSGHVDTVLVFGKPMDEVEKSVKKIIERLDGKWLEGTAVPTAIAKADKHERLFMLDKEKHALYITEREAAPKGEKWDEERQLKEDKAKIEKFAKLPAPNTTPPFAIKMMVTEPGKFGRAPVFGQMIPTTMERLTFQVDALPAGSAMLHVQLWDDTLEHATKDLDTIQVTWGEIQLGALLKGISIPDATWKMKGKLVYADIEVDKTFLDRAAEIGEETIEKEAKAQGK